MLLSHTWFICGESVRKKWGEIKHCPFKGIVHLKKKFISSCTHPQVVSNVYEFLSSAEHKWRYFEECQEPNSWTHWFPYETTISYYGSQWRPSTVWLPTFFKISPFFCSAEERNSYRFETTWGWVNDDRIFFIFKWTISLREPWL